MVYPANSNYKVGKSEMDLSQVKAVCTVAVLEAAGVQSFNKSLDNT